MNRIDWKIALIVCLFLSAGFCRLIELARAGEAVAWLILGAVLVMMLLLIVIGSITIIVRTIAASEQTAFINNARENLTIMRHMQALQNAQTTHLARRNVQLEQQMIRRLPDPEADHQAIIFDAEIFEDLDKPAGKSL